MNNKSRLSRSAFALLKQTAVAVFAAFVLVAVPVAGNAQETTSVIRGTVLAPDGGPAAGVSINAPEKLISRVRQPRIGRFL